MRKSGSSSVSCILVLLVLRRLQREKRTAAELAAEFEISYRTTQRHIEYLRTAGYTVNTERRGRGGNYPFYYSVERDKS